jgi:hypothetical protein
MIAITINRLLVHIEMVRYDSKNEKRRGKRMRGTKRKKHSRGNEAMALRLPLQQSIIPLVPR